MNKYVVVGANGFIGRDVTSFFCTKGETFSITREVIDLSKSPYPNNLENAHIIYCAGIPRSKNDSTLSKSQNLKMLENTLLSFKEPRSFTFMSSVEVYGMIHNEKIHEATALNPHNLYAEGKVIAEEMIEKAYSKQPQININILRLPGVYSMNSTLGLMGIIKNKITSCEPLILNNKGLDHRDFLYLPDLSKVTFELLKLKKSQTLNIATGRSIKVRSICELIAKNNSKFSFTLNNNIDSISNLIFDTKNLDKTLPELQLTGIEDGLEKINYFI